MSTEIPGNISSTASISVGQSLSGHLDFNGDTDWYKVQLQAGFAYQIWLEGWASSMGSLLDPRVSVRSGTGTVLTYGDDIDLFNFDAYVYFLPAVLNTYFISAEESGNNGVGTYKLTVWLDQLGSSFTSAAIAANSVVTDRLGWQGDISDWYAVTLNAGIQYQFDLVGSDRHGSTLKLVDPFLLLRSNTGAILASDNDGGIDSGSRIFFTPSTTGTFYLNRCT
jgi:hypothetical protein